MIKPVTYGKQSGKEKKSHLREQKQKEQNVRNGDSKLKYIGSYQTILLHFL